MLSLNKITKGFTDSHGTVPLFDNLDLRVESGHSASLMGASGCGKSTLLHMMASLLPVTDGEITLESNGKTIEISNLDEREADAFRRDSVGIVFQRYNLIEYLSARDNIILPAKHKKNLDLKFIESTCEQLQIAQLLHKSPLQLSGGEQQRVAIARALAHKPSLVLADEPTGNLDPKTSDIVAHHLYDLCKTTHTTLIIVTHSAKIADMADESYSLEELRLAKRTNSNNTI